MYDIYVYTITCVYNKIHIFIYTSSTNSTGPKCGGQVLMVLVLSVGYIGLRNFWCDTYFSIEYALS